MRDFKINNTIPFWLFTLSLIMILVVSQLIQEGMFMDGLFYTCVGKNLADGLGSFWNPHLSKTYMYTFHVQPPLYFGILAVFYKVLGSSMYVERLFSLVFFTGTAFYIHIIWKRIYKDKLEISKHSWLPILFWSTIPICFWAYTNNVEEVVMSFFAIASVYHIYIAIINNERMVYNLIVAGVFIFLTSLTKGIQGMFPLIGVGAFWILSFNISFKKMLYYSLILFSVPIIIYGFLILTNKDVLIFYDYYFKIRYVRSFNNVESTTTNRLDIIIQLFMEILPILSISTLFLGMTKKRRKKEGIQLQYKLMFWFVLIGLAGSLPLMVTLEQRNFYLVTCLPYFAIAISMLIAPQLTSLIDSLHTNKLGFKITLIICTLLFMASIIFTVSMVGKVKRDADALSDINSFGKILPHGDIISIPSEMMEDWSTRYYLLRYYYLSLDIYNKDNHYFMIRKNLSKALVPKHYKAFPLKTKFLDLYILDKKINQ